MDKNNIVTNLNILFNPFNLKVDDIIEGSQSLKFIFYLPLNIKEQGKIRRAESNIKYALSSALGTSEYNYGHEKNYVYVEIKNNDFKAVLFANLKDVTNSNKLYLVLGIDENGNKVYTNLSKAPHILVGGTTGSGKSELLHTFIASLVSGMPYTKAELLIIDPKRAEYSPYKNCKRIMVITEMNVASDCLNQAVNIMESRYAELERSGAKDIYKYSGPADMHPIVIIIDELADLMMSNPDIEKSIVRIAQKARACGIHLIIGTQSPRRHIITGMIQANVPTKIALKTADSIESRIIIGSTGAERLYGKGDMLFLSNGAFKPIRVQSAYVDENTKLQLTHSIARPIEQIAKPVNHPITPRRNNIMEVLKWL